MTERLHQHEAERPAILSQQLASLIHLVRGVYPRNHPNYQALWPDLVSRLSMPRATLHQVEGTMVRLCQVKLGELWLRERGHQEGQVACCRRDMARGLARLEGEFTRVAQWARTRRGQQEVARWVVTTVWVTAHHHPREAGEGQRQVCERLHGELALLREYRLLREEERSRIEGRERGVVVGG